MHVVYALKYIVNALQNAYEIWTCRTVSRARAGNP
jgi:hypothetical protein